MFCYLVLFEVQWFIEGRAKSEERRCFGEILGEDLIEKKGVCVGRY